MRPLLPSRMQEARDGVVSLVIRPGGHGLAFEAMPEVVYYASSALLHICNALVQLGSREAQHCFVNQCKNEKVSGPDGESHTQMPLHLTIIYYI